MAREKNITELLDKIKDGGVYAFCDDCAEQTFVDELYEENAQAYGICNECLNTAMVSLEDLQHTGKSF